MRTIHSRTYTNVVLTVLAILLLAVLLRPYLGLEKACADSSDSDQRVRSMVGDPNAALAAATREVASSNKEIANAILETARAQKEVAQSIAKLTQGAAK